MGGCQNYHPLLSSLNTRCRIILRTQKGTVILTTTHMDFVSQCRCLIALLFRICMDLPASGCLITKLMAQYGFLMGILFCWGFRTERFFNQAPTLPSKPKTFFGLFNHSRTRLVNSSSTFPVPPSLDDRIRKSPGHQVYYFAVQGQGVFIQ